MEKIKLTNNSWKYNPLKPLGEKGGFGEVFSGKSIKGDSVAVKRLYIDASGAAHRELRVAEELSGRELKHVIPFFDSGEDAETGLYFVIMPKADKSLQDDIEKGCTYSSMDTVDILLQIANGLVEVSDIVHRDLKPANILYQDGKWKVADFGIARFCENSTSLRTLKGSLTPAYAAPEQWNFEHATSATDIYALGCIGVCLFNGSPPFTSKFKENHLSGSLPVIESDNPRLKSLLIMMLRKLPDARPSIERVRTILSEIKTSEANKERPVHSNLILVGAVVAEQESKAHAEREAIKLETKKRHSLAFEAQNLLSDNFRRLIDIILREAPSASENKPNYNVSLGVAQLSLLHTSVIMVIEENRFKHSSWDVITSAKIELIQRSPLYKWTSSLWYVKLPDAEDYRWMEVSYFSPLKPQRFEPFALDNLIDADYATSPIMHTYQAALGPKPIDDENEDDFHGRWSDLLSKAAMGQLCKPQRLPIID